MTAETFLDRMFLPDDRDRALFGDAYDPPASFRAQDGDRPWFKVATYRKAEGGDGQDAEVWESRMPARFFKVVALPSTNGVGELVPGFALATGSGDEMGRLCVRIAQAAAAGMIAVAGD